MPAGIAHAPGRIPFQGLVLELGLGEPQDEVVAVALVGVFLHALADAHHQVLLLVLVEHIIFLQLGGIEIHVAAGQIGIALFQQALDHLDELLDAVGCRLHHIGGLDVQLFAVGKEGVGIETGDLHDRLVLPLSALEHLVLAGVGVRGQVAHIGDVHDPLHIVTAVAQVFFQHVLHDIGPQVADVSIVVHRRAAGVHFHLARLVGVKFFFFVGQGIIELHNQAPFWVKPSLMTAKLSTI